MYTVCGSIMTTYLVHKIENRANNYDDYETVLFIDTKWSF